MTNLLISLVVFQMIFWLFVAAAGNYPHQRADITNIFLISFVHGLTAWTLLTTISLFF